MGTFFVYILKSAICMALFYLFYRLLLSKETFYRFNRVSLLFMLILSLLLPLIAVTVAAENEVQQTLLILQQILMMADKVNVVSYSQRTHITWAHVVLMIYLAGVLFFACRNIYSLIRLFALVKSSRRVKQEKGITLLVHEQEIAPFSWMNYIFISEKELGEESSQEILIHELAHIHNRHSLDLLVAEVCVFIQWFNPAAWLIKQELQNIHEYEADETVINQGIDAKKYQLLLIKKAVGTRLYSMANSFNHSKLKKRITMMLKEKSNPWARLKCLYVLPVAAIAITAFARPEISNELKEISGVKVSDLTSIVEAKPVKNTHPEIDLKLQQVKKAVSDVSTTSSRTDDTLKVEPLVVIGFKSTPAAVSKPLIFVDGEEVSTAVAGAINPQNIASIDVLKGKSATDKYGDKGKDGVILVKLKKIEVLDLNSGNVGAPHLELASATYYVDGKKMTSKEFKELNLKNSQITTVNVKKNQSGGNVIEVTTKPAVE
uniref:M56 family metallopeptidase n=1 Tax=Bacteroides ihuae TaxID=1852362 RepID=UPI00098FB5C1